MLQPPELLQHLGLPEALQPADWEQNNPDWEHLAQEMLPIDPTMLPISLLLLRISARMLPIPGKLLPLLARMLRLQGNSEHIFGSGPWIRSIRHETGACSRYLSLIEIMAGRIDLANHDHAYKLLFSNAPLVADLIQGFVTEEWVEHTDFSTLERVGDGYVSEDLRERESDVVWRLRWGRESWVYVYLLLEFQSTVDPSMAMRVLAYVSLLYQDLLRQGVRTSSGRLPPILPVVLYNGNRQWNAPLDAEDLIEEIPGGLERHRPSLRYWLIDESRLAASELAFERNAAAVLFHLEREGRLAEIEQGVRTLDELLDKEEHRELRRAFAIWLSQVLLPSRLPGVQIPAVADLREVRTMLAENTIDWTREWKDLGREEGREEGRQEGRQEERHKTLQALCPVVLAHLEQRFGPLSEETRRRVEDIDSAEELTGLLKRLLSASSLAELGLA